MDVKKRTKKEDEKRDVTRARATSLDAPQDSQEPAQEPAQDTLTEPPIAEHAPTLATLHRIPSWREDAAREAEVLDELCAVSIGGVGQQYHPAFVAKRASDFSGWLRRPSRPITPRRASTPPDIEAFRTFMARTRPEEYVAWQQAQRHAEAVAKSAAAARDPLTSPTRRVTLRDAQTTAAWLAQRTAEERAAEAEVAAHAAATAATAAQRARTTRSSSSTHRSTK